MKERFLALSKYAGAVVTVGGILLLLRLCLPALLAVSLPFLFAWGLALLVRPLSEMIGRKTVISQRVLRVCLAVLAFLLIGIGVFLVFRRLWRELGDLLAYLSENSEQIGAVTERIEKWLSHLPLPSGAPSPFSMLSSAVSDALTSLSRFVGSLLIRLPSLLLFLLVTVIASVYFALDLERINAAALRLLPERCREGALRLRGALARGCAVYLRSYALLFCMTLALVLVGFLLLGVRYAFLLALLVALVDLLPILGVGCALCPWAAVCLMMGQTGRGAGLLLLWLTVTVARQVAEPRLVGGRLGLPPLLTLFAMYAGLKLFGILGMLLAPLALAAARPLFAEQEEIKGAATRLRSLL